MMEDCIFWQQKCSRRHQVAYIKKLTVALESRNLSQPRQVAVAEELESVKSDLVAFLDGSFQSVEGNLIPKYY